MKTNHTPGPWKASGNMVVGGRTPKHGGHALFVAHCEVSTDYRSDDETAANVRLIAAVPELLAALESITGAFTTEQLENVLGAEKSVAVREALAKARGAR